MLTGGRGVSGGPAAGVAGEFFRRLTEQNYLAESDPVTPAALLPTSMCCSAASN
jgi:hypothetical protein